MTTSKFQDTTIVNLPQANSSSIVAMDPLVAMIERAARDPSIDMDRLERLLDMQERSQARTLEANFNVAMSAAQMEMRAVAADANNPQTRSKYASYFALDKAIRPIYSKHGISLSFDTDESPAADHVRIVCFVSKGGFTRKYHVDMPADGKGAKGGDVMTKTHAVGAAMTYGQRYLLRMIFNIAIGEDKDGNDTGELIRETDVSSLRKALKYAIDFEAEEKALCAYLKIESLEDMPASYLQRALDAIGKKAAATKAATLKERPQL